MPPSFLERISTDATRDTVDGGAAEYLALLDRCLLDGTVSASEGAQLAEVAAELGLARSVVDELHADYFTELERRAWVDGVLTEAEKFDLRAVGALLQLSDVAIEAATDDLAPEVRAESEAGELREFTLMPGSLIVLTGEMSRARSDWEAELLASGFVPHGAITKKVALLVAADPDSLSGKAKKARDYGIPIVGETWLREFLS